MKSGFLYISVVLAGLFVGCSSTHQMNPTPGEQSSSRASIAEEEFTKERQLKDAYEKGLKEGVAKGHDQAINIITKEYLPYIKRLEAGKYAMRKGFITPPEVMVFQNTDGTLSYKTTGCKIEKELDINDIFKRFGESVLVNGSTASKEEVSQISGTSDSYFISERDTASTGIQRSGSQIGNVIKSIEKTAANKIVLDEYNIRYTEKDGLYLATFSTQEETDGFCGQFHICIKD